MDEAERRDLCDLVASSIPTKCLHKAAQNKFAVRLKNHVDKVDDDDSANVAKPQLPHDLFGSLKIVPGDGLFQGAPGTDELTRIDVNYRHRLGALNDESATAGQPNLAVHPLCQLGFDVPLCEDIVLGGPFLEPVKKLRGQLFDILVNRLPRLLTLHGQSRYVLVKEVPNHADHHFWLTPQEDRSFASGRNLLLNLVPLFGEALNVVAQLLL